MTLAIEAEGLTKRFGATWALRGIDLEAPTGSILGLLGPNGSGKTTAVRILATLLRPDAGKATVGGYDVTRRPMAVRTLVGVTGQDATVDEHLTGWENLDLFGNLLGLRVAERRRRAAGLLERVDLTEAADRRVKTYSGGMRRRLDLAVSLIGYPRILFLDEPTTGLDPRSRTGIWAVIRELVAEGTTVLLTTQYLEEAAGRGPPHQESAQRRAAGVQPLAGGAARAGGAGDRPLGQCLGVASLAGAAVPGPGRLPGRRRAGLPGPVAAAGAGLKAPPRRPHGRNVGPGSSGADLPAQQAQVHTQVARIWSSAARSAVKSCW
jgi:oleandomycin transport system ATP-binding protein